MPTTAPISRADRAQLKKLALQRGYTVRRTPAGLFWLERGGRMELGDCAAGCVDWLLEQRVPKANA
jgi:hypothetical protein